MKREVAIAIFFGLVFGLIVTIGVYRARTALERPIETTPAPIVTEDLTETPEPSESVSSGLRIIEPPVDAYVQTASVQITGSTFPESTIVILHKDKEYITRSDAFGNFSLPVILEQGGNVFLIRVLSSGNTPQEVLRTIVYDPVVVPPATKSASPTTPNTL